MTSTYPASRATRTLACISLGSGVTAIAALGILLATGHSDTAHACMLGLAGTGCTVVAGAGAVEAPTTGAKAIFVTAAVLILIAASTLYGLTWS